ncbi:MAG: N-acetylmuramoyl-L-alanine amidase [Pseudanabaenaceae cyanobacterium SKYGB_i_bin29]|nr:N-acetylmuramoyl-L-alanine amidase [Pseudanabaenaceae cyanobacterium SKYG29]MDW8421707.1 N-acetylmuramoyl-L-alanine amidase [Pseudanabaenaceae cyanobacterium SKYGB_i_bin29]
MKQWAWLCLAGCLSQGIVQAQSIQAQLPSVQVSSLLRVQGVRSTANGLLLLINGNPQVRMERVVEPDRLVIDLSSTAIPKELHKAVIPVNQFGVQQARIAQFDKDVTRIVLDLLPGETGEWITRFEPQSGLLISPSVAAAAPSPAAIPVPLPSRSVVANLQGFVVEGMTKVIIQADQPTTVTGSQDTATNTFNLVISPAQLSPSWGKSVLEAHVPIERVRVTQLHEAVVASFKLSPGWQMREGKGGSFNQIILELIPSSSPSTIPPLPKVVPPSSQAPLPEVVPTAGKKIVVVDPGHGGGDPGAIANGVQEKDVVLAISLAVGRELQRLGHVVYYTRTQDVEIDLEPRVRLAEQVRANVFVSVHANSLASQSSHVNGIETFFAPGSRLGRELAELVQNEVIAATGARDRGVKSARFYVVHRTTMPSILVETGFVTNPQEAANLANPVYQQKLGEGIARGVHQFLSR